MDNGTAEAEPADIAANKDVSTPVEDVPDANTKSEAVGPVEESESGQSTISTDEEQVQPEGGDQNREESSGPAIPESTIDSSSAVDSVDDSEISGMEMGSSVSEDVISPEEADPIMPEESEGTPETDTRDSESTPVIESIIDAAGGTGGGDSAEEGLDSAAETVVDSDNHEESESSMKVGGNSPTESDAAAEGDDNLQSNEEDPTDIHVEEVEVPEGAVEEPRGDNSAENHADVTSDGPSTGSGTTDAVEEDEAEEPDSESEPLVLEDSTTPDAELSESAKQAKTDVVDEVSQQDGGEEHGGIADSVETPANVEREDNASVLESGAQVDSGTLEAEAVENSSLTADVGDSVDESESSPTVSGEDGVASTIDEEQGGAETDPISLTSGEDNQHVTQEAAEPELEDELSPDSDGNELVHGAVTEECTESGAGIEDDQRPVLDGTDTSPSNSAEIAEVLEADGPVVDVGQSPESPTEAEEIVEVVADDQDVPASVVETAEEEQVVRPDAEMETPVQAVPDAPESNPLASADTGDAAEHGIDTDASQVSSIDEAVGGVIELDAPASSMEELEEEQVAELGSEVEAPAVETEGGGNADTSDHPNLNTEEPVEGMSREQDAPTPSIEEAEEEHVAGPGPGDPDATEISSPSTDEVAESLETVDEPDALGNTDSLNVVDSGSDENVEGVTYEHDVPTSAIALEEEGKEAETVREIESPGETNTEATNTEQDPSADITQGLTVGGASEVSEETDEPVSSSDTTEIEGVFEQDEAASGSEMIAEKQVAGSETGASVDTDTVPDSVEASPLVPVSFDVPVIDDELVDTDTVLEVGTNQQDDPISGLEAVKEEQVVKIDGEVDAPGGTDPDATATGLLNSAKVHPEVLEADDASDCVEKVDASHLTSDNVESKEVVLDDHDGPIATEDESSLLLANDGDDELSSISPEKVELDMGQEEQVTDSVGNVDAPSLEDVSRFASGTSEEPEEEKKVDLDETLAPEKEQKQEASTGSELGNEPETVETDESAEEVQPSLEAPQEPESSVAILSDHQHSTLVRDEQISGKEASGVGVGDEDLVGGTESSTAGDVSVKSIDNPEHMVVEEVSVSMTPDVVTTKSTLTSEGVESHEAEGTELPYSEPAAQNSSSYSASENNNLLLATESALSTHDVVSEDSLKGDSQKDNEVGEAGLEVRGSAEAIPDVSRESESLKDIILEHGSEVQELMRVVAESSSSPAIEEKTPTVVQVPSISEASKSREVSSKNDTPWQASTAAEKVISTTDVKNMSANEEHQEDSADKDDFLPYSLPTHSSGAEENLKAKRSTNGTDKLPEGSTHADLHSSAPSTHADTDLGDGVVEQKEISGDENISVKNVVTTEGPLEAVKTASISLPGDSETKDSSESNDLKFQDQQSVYSPDKLQMELSSMSKANVAAKGKEDFLKEGEIQPMKRQHLIHAIKGSTLASSRDVDAFQKSPDTVDSSRRGVSAAESPIISQGGELQSPIKTESNVRTLKSHQLMQSARKDETSFPLSTYSGDLSSSWVPLASASEVHSKSKDSEENVIEKHMPRLRAVARGGEDKRTMSERDLPTASITPAKSSDPVPKSRAQIIRNEDLNDAKFPLSIMLWCSQSLSSLFGSAKSL